MAKLYETLCAGLLSILAFLLSVLGTFLVRSGILTSVHTFALDPSRGIYILLFTAFLGGYSLFLFALKSKKETKSTYISFFSKGGSILVNNILMVTVCFSVLLGTIYPLLIEAFTNSKISVGEPYYNTAVIPIIIPAILIMGIGPILSWEKENKLLIFKKILPSILLTLLMTVLTFIIYKSYSLIGLVGIMLSYWIISNNIFLWIKKKSTSSISMIITHLGVGFLILGITGSSVWQQEKIVKMKLGDKVIVKNYNFILEDIHEVKGPNYLALKGDFLIKKEKETIAKLSPEKRFYPITNNFTTEASIHTNIFRDLYAVLGDGNINEGWTVRLYYNPLVMWIWIGALTIFFGGLLSIKKNLKKII